LLLIRADGGPSVGFGHVTRSLAVAEAWMERGGRCLWATNSPRALEARRVGGKRLDLLELEAHSGSGEDAETTRQIAGDRGACWVLADLFSFEPDYFAQAGRGSARWLIAHDEPLRVNARIDAVFNHGPQATPDFFPGRRADCRLLLGLDYALIRTEVQRSGGWAAKGNPPRRILITFGGSDPGDLSWAVVSVLISARNAEESRYRLILGPGYRGRCLEARWELAASGFEIVRDVSDMGQQYAWADLILCGASTTLWEAWHYGLPAVVLPVAPNQRLVFEALERYPAACRFAAADDRLADWMQGAVRGTTSIRDWIEKAGNAAAGLVDGRGAQRVVEAMWTLA